MIYRATVGLFSKKASFAIMLVLLPCIAQAGLLSFVAGLLTGRALKLSATVVNSQTIEILEASLSPYSNLSLGGGEIAIVDDSALEAQASPLNSDENSSDRPQSDQISMYVVRSGDNLSAIANMFDVSVNTIIWTNNLKGKVVNEGQVLVILPISGVRYAVKSGDTIQSIAKKHKGDVEEILDYNDIESGSKLAVGKVIIIPDGEITAPAITGSRSLASSGGSLPVYAGYYMRPVKGGVKTQGIHGFNGIDIGVPSGTTLYASADGDVLISKGTGWNGGYGGYTVVAHSNGTQTLYAHLSSVIVFQGQHVVQGQIIGYTGSTGKSSGPHLHFEVRGAKIPF